ncbi:MAG: DUF1801 domain-containing protein [Gemmataceae bacterium]|nr:DUF1801 domain-containing protein [Gemmataceae bacterium]
MVQSQAATAQEYLDSLPEDRRAVISTVRDVLLKNLPAGYQEAMCFGMLSYEVPLEKYPNTYNGQPLSYIALAAQKNYYALYIMSVYGDAKLAKQLQDGFKKAGKKLDMGKCCVRFKKLEDLPLDVIGKLVKAVTPKQFIARYEASRKK